MQQDNGDIDHIKILETLNDHEGKAKNNSSKKQF